MTTAAVGKQHKGPNALFAISLIVDAATGKQHKGLNALFVISLIVDASAVSQTVIIASLL